MSCLNNSRSIENTGLAIIAFFVCFGYTTGTDWNMYEQFYENKIDYLTVSKEYGYYLFQSFFSAIGVNFWIFHIAVKLLMFYLLVRFVRLFEINIFLFFLFFLPDAGFYLFIDCPFRNLIALGIIFFAIEQFMNKHNLAYFLLVALAITFHASAITMIPIFFIMKTRANPLILLILVVFSYALAFQAELLFTELYLPIAEMIPVVKERLLFYFKDQQFVADGLNPGSLLRLSVCFLLFFYWKRLIAILGDKYYFVLVLSFIFLLLYPWGVAMKIFQRFYLFVLPFYTLSILYIIKSLQKNWMTYMVHLFMVLFALFQSYKLLTYDHRYIPYTHYLFFTDKDSKFRQEYNIKHSPYTNTEDFK
jgi:hypothetical protein